MIQRREFIAAVIVATALAADAQSSGAQESFFNERFCAQTNSVPSGIPDCSFYTWEQCIASARGLGKSCTTNPWWHGPR
jgi:hypothetical protein